MQSVPINDWRSFRNVFSEEGFSYEFRGRKGRKGDGSVFNRTVPFSSPGVSSD